ncbi:GNAT family N-acetyltransferase [Georgenia thermotolerans]|uniref:GNAT family N-acetyltransferase n=1 Tax=Georgenia thermotolerans TaxID=527326 RepID=A0A7J5UK80_9MICO|nr:GNAT family N-acetyltransferase [Georgenia thermotolerans]KAE8762680.1 GNAT family N-acetyltransferase [Georgenia thermotolerans]
MRPRSDGLSTTTTASGEELLGRWPFWRANRGHYPLAEAWGAPGGRAALALCVGERRRLLVGLGTPEHLAPLVAATELPAVDHVILTRGTWGRLTAPERQRTALTLARDWDWMSTDRPPAAQPGEDRVGPLPGRLDDVHAVLARAYPERGARPGDAELDWWGYPAPDGTLTGVLAAEVPGPGAGEGAVVPAGAGVHLSAVAVDPAHRRGGVARTMVAAVTRRALERAPVVHLGIWADHDGARRLYASLGFAVGQEFEGLDPR